MSPVGIPKSASSAAGGHLAWLHPVSSQGELFASRTLEGQGLLSSYWQQKPQTDCSALYKVNKEAKTPVWQSSVCVLWELQAAQCSGSVGTDQGYMASSTPQQSVLSKGPSALGEMETVQKSIDASAPWDRSRAAPSQLPLRMSAESIQANCQAPSANRLPSAATAPKCVKALR